MQIEAIRQYLTMFMNAVAENTTGAEIAETEDGPVLYCAVKSPFEGQDDIGYQITMLPYADTIFAAEIVMFVFTGIDKQKLKDIGTLINRLNQYLTLGNYRVFEEDGSVMFCHGMMLDEEMQITDINELMSKTITVMEDTVVNTGDYILRLLNGEELSSVIEEVGKGE